MTSPAASPVVRLVRLPSVITVPGDVLAGAAWAPDRAGATAAARVASSSMAYLAGMALNDWADRAEDAVERPTRPIPAGEIGADTALAIAATLSAGALVLAAMRGPGHGSLAVTAPLLATVWAYDLKAKQTPAGPWAMALARALDVLVGARRPRRDALAPAGLIGAHTLLITFVSRQEAHGASRELAAGALGGVALTTAAAAAVVSGAGGAAGTASRAGRALQFGCVAVYASIMTRAGIGALRDGDAASAQRFVGAGVFANMPLQAAMLAARGRAAQAAAVLGCWQFGRRLGRKVAVT
jgi:UbiA prenyltransferase family